MHQRRAIPFSGQVPQSLEQHVSSKPHLRNRERTFHMPSLPSTNTSRRAERRRPLLGSTRRVGLNGMLQHSASPPSPGLDHERAEDSRRAIRRTTRGELASSPRRQPTSLPNNALRWRRGEARVTERVVRVYQQRQTVPAAVSLRRIASLVPAGPAALSSQRLQQCVVAAEAARRRGQL